MKQDISISFDPWQAIDALRGVTEAMHWHVTEGPGAEQPMSTEAHASLVGLSWVARRLSHELAAYFRAASEAGLELPEPQGGEDGVAEARANYELN